MAKPMTKSKIVAALAEKVELPKKQVASFLEALASMAHREAKNGFTMEDSTAIVAGTVVTTNGKAAVQVSGSNDVLTLVPGSSSVVDAASFAGKSILVEGTIPEASKGKVPDTIDYRSIKEGR